MNPRRRDTGYHNIFDHYNEMLGRTGSHRDGIHFHYHPMPFSKQANHCATHFFAHSDSLFQILGRRIIDRHWFPSCFRAGYHTIRPDSNFFLEQFIPFSLSNQACNEDYSFQKDLAHGRFGDWRRAPKRWAPYHPSHDDYQVPGNCRRWEARCLNIGTRVRVITQADVDQAFKEAAAGDPVVMAFTNHDFRDMRNDILLMRRMLMESSSKYPEVTYCFSEARNAIRKALSIPVPSPFTFSLDLAGNRLTIRSDRPIFGPQPFFAIKTVSGDYYHDNLDFQIPSQEWTYVLDEQTFPTTAVQSLGVAASDAAGNVCVATLDVRADRVTVRHC